jgi:acyl-coenzyme A synthetase/AMP-(fatty) acid ligase
VLLRETLSSYKAPRYVRLAAGADLPKLPTGKVDIISLRAIFEDA